MTKSILLLCIIVIIETQFLAAQESKILRSRTTASSGQPSAALMNINNMKGWYESDGTMENNPFTGNAGVMYPPNGPNTIYSSGLMWGGYINDGAMDFIQPRVNGQMYNSGMKPGKILGTRTGITEDPADPTLRIYKIRRDLATADLKYEVTDYQCSLCLPVYDPDPVKAFYLSYVKDWKEWPASKGAPFYDAEGDGKYEPKFVLVNGKEVPLLYPMADEPGYANADMVIWFVANDTRDSLSPWKTRSAGLEEQVTIWAYNRPAHEALGNTVFKRFRLIFKGTAYTKDTTRITNMYLGHWADPDLGFAGDDHVGVDSSLSLGYVYNANFDDSEYKKFNLAPPAVGYLLLQGPTVPSSGDTAVVNFARKSGVKNLPVSSFTYHATGGNYGDPPFTLNGSWQHYSQLMGLPPTPQPPPFPDPVIDPFTNLPTRFWLNGDPVTTTGWIDGKNEKAGDRRFFLPSGPFEMAVNDTQEVVYALIGASSSDRTGNISVLKDYARSIRRSFLEGFASPVPTYSATATPLTDSTVAVTVLASAARGTFRRHSADLVRSNGDTIATLQLFDDGAHQDGGFNDGVFGNTDTVAAESALISVRGRATDMLEKTSIYENAVKQLSIPGALTHVVPVIYSDNIDNNRKVSRGEYVRFGVTVKNTTKFLLRGLTLIPEIDVQLGASWKLKNLLPGGLDSMSYDPWNTNSYFSVRVPYNHVEQVFTIPFVLRDSTGNKWRTNISFPLYERPLIRDSVQDNAENIIGSSDVKVGYVLHNPDYAGRQYDLLFGSPAPNSVFADSWTVVPVDSAGPLLTLKCVIGKSSFPPYQRGEGTFTVSRNRDSLRYSIQLRNITLPVTSAYIRTDLIKIKTLSFTDSIAEGWMTSTDAGERWHDSLVTKFRAGKFEVVIIAGAATYTGTVGNGSVLRQNLYRWTSSPLNETKPPMLFASYNEVLGDGFSLYTAAYMQGIKQIVQTAPDSAGDLSSIHSSRNYFMGSLSPISTRQTNKHIEIRFNSEINWAMAYSIFGVPASAKAIRVPFAVYLDTTRVWPVIYKPDLQTDTTWRMTDSLSSGQKIFQRIVGILDERDGSNIDIRYYAPSNAIFPPTSTGVKGRLINSANFVVRDLYFGNAKGENVYPQTGTTIKLFTTQSPLNGDIKRITLKRAVPSGGGASIVPSDYVLEHNYPNPFNPVTNIRFGVPRRSYITLAVFDILGRTVRTLAAGESFEGTFTVQWDGRNDDGIPVSSGVYFYRLSSGSSAVTQRMLLLK
jgi:hypothetical protein